VSFGSFEEMRDLSVVGDRGNLVSWVSMWGESREELRTLLYNQRIEVKLLPRATLRGATNSYKRLDHQVHRWGVFQKVEGPS